MTNFQQRAPHGHFRTDLRYSNLAAFCQTQVLVLIVAMHFLASGPGTDDAGRTHQQVACAAVQLSHGCPVRLMARCCTAALL
jgi:hypothetical protein